MLQSIYNILVEYRCNTFTYMLSTFNILFTLRVKLRTTWVCMNQQCKSLMHSIVVWFRAIYTILLRYLFENTKPHFTSTLVVTSHESNTCSVLVWIASVSLCYPCSSWLTLAQSAECKGRRYGKALLSHDVTTKVLPKRNSDPKVNYYGAH